MSTASRRRRLQALALAGAMAAALAVIALAGPLAPTRVEVAPATVGDLTPTVFGIGTLEARRLHTVGPVRSGRILRLEADHGDSVERG
ncbi:MAG TPA: efflux transporter periplasmic adaptor subunit, partial [Chromatiales bacterium]|nr:efflux transporter periplasmic adaptor subunit [Chromatiales bacterium]